MGGKEGGNGKLKVLRLSLRPAAQELDDGECPRFVPRPGPAVEGSIFLKEYVSKNSTPTAETKYIFRGIHASTRGGNLQVFRPHPSPCDANHTDDCALNLQISFAIVYGQAGISYFHVKCFPC